MENYEQQLIGIESSLYDCPSWVVVAVQSICETILRERDKGYTIFLEEFEEINTTQEKVKPRFELIKGDKE